MDMQVTQPRVWGRYYGLFSIKQRQDAFTETTPILRSARSRGTALVSHVRHGLLAFGLIATTSLQAAPSGGQIVGGVGSIHQSGLTTTIQQQTGAMAIDWNTFNVNVDERVQFQQPDVSSIALNRILDQLPSQINGRLDANGRIVLVNPNGLFFGNNASINVGGLIASGLDIDPMDFMNGDYQFEALENSAGTVFNAGLIQASLGGSVALLGKQVQNQGMISADLGIVALAAGKQAVLTFDHSGLLGLRITEAVLQDELGIDPAVLNSGDISAAGGKVLMTASVSQDVFSEAVNTGELQAARSVVVNADGSVTLGSGADLVNTGTVNVSSESSTSTGQIVMLGENITQRGVIRADQQTTTDTTNPTAGQIELHAQDTLLLTDNSLTSASADTGSGGEIVLLGKNVGLFDDARLALNGDTGGGSLLFGGDLRGENPDIPNASAVYIGEATSIQADAIRDGDGGRIIIYATDSAKVFGNISATGGALGGDGGFLETSAGVVNLDFAVDVGAPNGSNGQWLIDPFNLSICSGDDCNDDATQNGNEFIADVMDSELDVQTLLAALVSGDVTVETGAGGMGEPNGGNITLDTELDYNGNNSSTLTLNAHHDIVISHSIFDSDTNSNDTLNLVFNADTNGMNGGDVVIGDMVDSETINNIQINTNGGLFTATTGDVTIDSAVTGDVTTGNVIIGNNVMLSQTDNTDGTTTINTGGGAFIVNTGDITITSTIDDDSEVAIGDVTTGKVIIGDVGNTAGTTTINTGGGLFDTKTGDITVASTLNGNSNATVTIGNVTTGDMLIGNINHANSTTTIDTEGDTISGVFDAKTGQITITSEVTNNGSVAVNNSNVIVGNVTTGTVMIGDTDSADGTGTTTINTGGGAFGAMTGDITITSEINNNASVTVNNAVNNSSVAVGNITTGTVVIGNADSADGTGTTTINTGDGAFDAKTGDVAITSEINNNDSVTANNAVNNGSVTVGNATTGTVMIGDTDSADGTGTTTINTGGGAFDAMTGDVTITSQINNNGIVTVNTGSATVGNVTTGTVMIGNADSTDGTGTTMINTEGGSFDTKTGDATIISTLNGNGNATVTIGNVTTGTVMIGGADSADGTGTTTINTGGENFTANTGTVGITLTDDEVIGDITIGGITIGNMNNTAGITTINTEGGAFTATGGSFGLGGVSSINTEIGALSVTTDGLVSALGTLTVGGATNINAGNGAIILSNTSNDFTGSASLNNSGNNDVTLVNSGALMLGSSNVGSGTLDITAVGITQSGAITQANDAGAATFNAGAGVLNLNNAGNSFTGAVSLNNSGVNDVTLLNSRALELGASNVGSGTLDITAVGITQSGAITQANDAGAATFNAGAGVLNLNNAGNSFTGAVSLNNSGVNDVTLLNSRALELGASNVGSGMLDIAAVGSITQSGELVVVGNADFMVANGESIILDDLNNDILGNVSFAAMMGQLSNLAFTNNPTINLDALDITGNLTIQSVTGTITQTGALAVDRNASFTAAGGQSIILLNPGNDIAGTVSFAAIPGRLNNVTFTNNPAIFLGALDITGNLTIQSVTGTITQTGALEVDRNASFTAAGGESIVLPDPGNDIAGTVSFAAIPGQLNNLAFTNNPTINLDALDITGNLTIRSVTGTITQTGALAVDRNASFTAAGGQSITLPDPGNDIAGTVSFAAMPGRLNNLAFTNNPSINLDALDITGNLTIQSVTGTITQTGALEVDRNASFTAAGGESILLPDMDNDIAGTVSFAAMPVPDKLNNVTFTNNPTINLDALDITGNLTIQSVMGDITQNGALTVPKLANFTAAIDIILINQANQFGMLQLDAISALVDVGSSVELGLVDIAHTFDIIAHAGDITQSNDPAKAITVRNVSGEAVFTLSDGKDIALNNENNNVKSSVSFAALEGKLNDVAFTNNPNILLDALDITGNLTIQSVTGTITQSGALIVEKDASFTVAGGESILLPDMDNDIAGMVSFAAMPGQLNDVTFTNKPTINLDALDITGDLTLDSTNGGIEQTDALVVAGLANLSAADDIILDDFPNDFASLQLTANTARVQDQNGIILGNSSTENELIIEGNGDINASNGALSVGGDTVIIANDGSILLSNPGNSFFGIVTLVNSGTNAIDIVNSRGLELGEIGLEDGALTITANDGDITQIGAIVQTGENAGNVTITAEKGSIELDNFDNEFLGAVSLNSESNASLVNSVALTLAESSIDGDLIIEALSGDITQTDALVVAGLANLSAADDIILDDFPNDFASLQLTANTARVQDQNGIILGNSSIENELIIEGNGDINASNGALSVGGDTVIIANDGSILLSNPGNSFFGIVTLVNSGTNAIDIVNSRGLELGEIGLEDGALTITANDGDITQIGAIVQTGENAGNVTITAEKGSIELDNFDNEFLGAVSLNSDSNASLVNSVALTLAESSIDGDLIIEALSGDITQIDKLNVAGSASFTVVDGESIILNNAGNNIVGNVSFTPVLQNLAFANKQDIILGALDIIGSLFLNSTQGSIGQTGAWVVAGSASLFAADDIILDNLQNDFNFIFLNANNVTLSSQNRLIFDNLSLTNPIGLALKGVFRQFP